MAAKKSVFFDKILPTLYSVGAAVVIFGAWAKILHKDFADVMLTVGLLTEAAIFLTFAFQSYFQDDQEYEWERVYPELSADYKGAAGGRSEGKGLNQLDAALASSQISADTFDSLKRGIQGLSDSASKMSDLGSAALATKNYTDNLTTASGAINVYSESLKTASGALNNTSESFKNTGTAIADLNKAFGNSINTINEVASSNADIKDYRNKLAEFGQKIGNLNAVYDQELADASRHLKSLNALYSNLNTVMDTVADAGKESQQFKNELNKLNANVSSLNGIYGSMLSAMKA
jgi:gliding motility-associated protein GldL